MNQDDQAVYEAILMSPPVVVVMKKKKKRKGKLAHASVQVTEDLDSVAYSTKVSWMARMRKVQTAARKNGHQLDGWAARHKYTKHYRMVPEYFVAVCKRCRAVFIAEKSGRMTDWKFPYEKCRATPRKVVRIGGHVVVSGEKAITSGTKRKFV